MTGIHFEHVAFNDTTTNGRP
uniref:Uncharacterized protein n=1 Tax=Ralstonia solanacearum TaxID=305 RepID=A0A0S4TYW2_RALSL|nr:protein of unknown function [Ralstonia solanacearum]